MTAWADRITEIKGTITLNDGTTSEFSLGTDGGWSQWGADTPRLGRTVDALEAMTRALLEEGALASDSDEDGPEDEDPPVECDECGDTSESGWGDQPTCLDCTPTEQVCGVHQRTFVGSTCPLDED